MFLKTYLLPVVAILLCAAQISARAADADQTDDQKFVTEVSTGNVMEVETGKVALKNAAGTDAREFASKMIADHSKANAELSELAAKKNWTVATALDEKHKMEVEKVSKLSGADFDKEYFKMMKEDHVKDVQKVKDAIPKLSDAELKSWAKKTLATMEEHLSHVDHILKADTK